MSAYKAIIRSYMKQKYRIFWVCFMTEVGKGPERGVSKYLFNT